jgi:UDP-2,3-diacylglucosamine hydrolase
MLPEAVYFVSDAHLGAEVLRDPEPERRLHALLESLPGRAGTLVIGGDLFDFWFEYRTAVPRRYFGTLARLRALREAGIEIHYLTGNHDFWLGHFLADELGVRTHAGALSLEAQGRRLWIHHGDGLIGGDLGYKLLRGVLRNRASIALYGLLHPDLGIPLALRVSRWSRGSRPEKPLDAERLWREIALPRFAEGYDAVVVGHFHHAHERHEPGRDFVLTGDWIGGSTYAVLENGALRLARWTDARAAGTA